MKPPVMRKLIISYQQLFVTEFQKIVHQPYIPPFSSRPFINFFSESNMEEIKPIARKTRVRKRGTLPDSP